jgi:hypothetical protein
LLVFLTSPARRRQRPAEPLSAAAVVEREPGRMPFSRSWARVAGYAFASLGVVGLGLGWAHYPQARLPAAPPKSALRPGATFAMPEQIGSWKRLTTEVPPLQKVETMGVSSQVWHYRRGDTLASLALDYPFRGYHDVTICYTLRGWDLLERRSHRRQGTNASPPFVEVGLQNHVGMHGALWFCTVDERGRWLPGADLNPGLRRSFLGRFSMASRNVPVTYQLQVLSTGFNPLKAEERAQVQQFFEEARMMLWRQLFGQMQSKK